MNNDYTEKAQAVVMLIVIIFVVRLFVRDLFGLNKPKPEVTNIPQVTSTPQPFPTISPSSSLQPSAKPSVKPVKATSTPIPTSIETISQNNAVKKAKAYLSYSAFSYDGLVNQLEYEKFSHLDAVYGVDKSGANWNEQAAKKAKDYMSYSSFSRGSLIDQLKYEKFTQEQAEYGANAVGI